MRVDALIPRMNKALEAARSLGMTVMLCPSDVVDNYAGWPQRETVIFYTSIRSLGPYRVATQISSLCPRTCR